MKMDSADNEVRERENKRQEPEKQRKVETGGSQEFVK